MHFSLIQLQYFVDVANAGSFTVAARRARVVQPTLSSAIRQLEENLGYEVFDRIPRRGVRLTRQGRRFYDEANKLLKHADALAKFVHKTTESLIGTLRLGMYQPLSVFRTPQLLRAFQSQRYLPSKPTHRISTGFEQLSPFTGRAPRDDASLTEPLHSGV